MGALDDIGFFDDDGNLTSSAIQGQINSMILVADIGGLEIMGTPLGLGIPEGGDLNYLSIETDLEDHEEKFPQFHKIYLKFFEQTTNILNLDASNVLKSIGISDPTQPLVDLVTNIQENLEGVLPSDLDVGALMVTKIPDVVNMDTIGILFGKPLEPTPVVGFLQNLINTEDLTELNTANFNSVIAKIFPPEEENYQNIIDAIDASKTEGENGLLGKLKIAAEQLPFFAGISIPDPLIEIPTEIFSAAIIGFEGLTEIPEILFTLGPPPGAIGFLLSFLQAMIEKLIVAIAELQFPIPAIELIGKLADGIGGLVEFLVDKLLGPVREALLEAWPDIEQHLVPACFFTGLLVTILKILIVVVIGVLLGPGLVMFGAAKVLGLID